MRGLCPRGVLRHTGWMTQKPPNDPKKDRLAKQLRANLARRKAQARAKRAGDADDRAEGIDAAGQGSLEKASPEDGAPDGGGKRD